jgi:hypothetical protein
VRATVIPWGSIAKPAEPEGTAPGKRPSLAVVLPARAGIHWSEPFERGRQGKKRPRRRPLADGRPEGETP